MGESIIERAKKARPYIEKAMTSLSDEDALNVPYLFKEWKAGIRVEEGERLYYPVDKTLYKVKPGKGHTTKFEWSPDITTSHFEPVVSNNEATE